METLGILDWFGSDILYPFQTVLVLTVSDQARNWDSDLGCAWELRHHAGDLMLTNYHSNRSKEVYLCIKESTKQ